MNCNKNDDTILCFIACILVGMLLSLFLVGCDSPREIECVPTKMEVNDKLQVSPAENVEVYYQYPKFPAGCELAATCQVLRAYGFDVTIEDFLDNQWIDLSNSDWVNSYYGDIYSTGFTFPPAIVRAIENYFMAYDIKRTPQDISGCSWEEFATNVQNGKPAITWFTIDYNPPRHYLYDLDGYYPWYNLHAITVYKIDDSSVYIADPIEGYTKVNISLFRTIWEECGSYAVVI